MIEKITSANFGKIKEAMSSEWMEDMSGDYSLMNMPAFDSNNLAKGVFLMPMQFTWKKKVDNQDFNQSNSFSLNRKERMRKAMRLAEKEGVYLKLVNPATQESFEKFYDYYAKFVSESGYQLLLNKDFLLNKDLTKYGLIEIYDRHGMYQGARFIGFQDKKICCLYKAMNNGLLKVDGGVDNVCEAFFFKLAAIRGDKVVSLGADLNIRGWMGRKTGLFFAKIKFGYNLTVHKSRRLRFFDLTEVVKDKFDLLLFISMEKKDQKPSVCVNLIEGSPGALREEDWNILCKSFLMVRLYDGNFNILRVN